MTAVHRNPKLDVIDDTIAGAVRCNKKRPLGDYRKLRSALKKTQFGVGGDMISIGKDDDLQDVCGLFEPLGMARDYDGNSVSLLVALVDLDDQVKEVLIPQAELQTDPRKARARFADAGLFIAHRLGFESLLSTIRPSERIRLAHKPGWHGNVFVTPDGRAFGQTNEDVRLDDALCDQVAGTFEGQVAALQAAFDSGVSHFALAVLVGVAGVICDRLEIVDTPILALVGESTKGKTTALSIAASSFGDPRPSRGLLSSLRTTTNAMEAIAARSNGTVLCCDEAAHLANDEAQAMLFTIAGGVSKGRMAKMGGLRTAFTWRTFALISSEQGIAQKINAGRTPMMNGAAVRCIELDVSLETSLSRGTMDVIEAIKHNFGHIGPLVADLLAKEEPSAVRERVNQHTNDLAGAGAEPLVRRGASIFGLLVEAGTLLQRAGVLDEYSDVRGVVASAWERYRSSSEADRLSPNQKAAATLKEKLFTSMGVHFVAVDETTLHREPLGWYEQRDGQVTFFVPSRNFTALAGDAVSVKGLASELERQGTLITPKGKNRTWGNVPGSCKPVSHYRLRFTQSASED